MDNTINSLVGNFVSNAGNSSGGLTDYQGKSYDPNTILALSRQVAASIDPNAIKGGVFGTKGESVGFNYDEATKLLGHPPSAAEQVILDMSRHLANEGVTDLNKVDASDTNRRFGSTYTGGGGTIYEIKKDADGKPVISSWSKDTSDKKTILTGLALAAAAFGIPGVTEGLLSSAPAGSTLATVGAGGSSTLGTLGAVGSDLTAMSGIAGGTGALTAAESAALYGGGANTLGSLGAVGSDLAGLSGIPAGTGALTAAESAALYGTGANTALSTIGTTGKTAAELAQLDLATGGAGGTLGAETLANATATGANVPTLTNLTAGSGVFTGAAAGITADSVAQKLAADAVTNSVVPPTNIPKTLIDPITGLVTSAAGNVLANRANQEGITDARNLINEYGKQADIRLTNAYTNAQNLGTAGRTDLGNIFSNQNTNLNNIINAQAGVYGDTNTALGNIYSNTGTNLQNLYNQQVGYQEPYQDIGRAGSKGLLANQDYLTKQFGTADLYSGLAPNYQFMLGQGQMANQRAGNMSGGALGGNAMTGLQRYTQDYAGNAYQQAFNNYGKQRSDIYNSLKGMADIGTTSAGQLTSLGNTYGSNMGSLSSNYAGNMVNNANQMQGAYNQYGGNLTSAANNYGSNLTSNYNTGVNAANVYGLNAANLAVGVGGALASNATASGANNATALSNLGNTALVGSMIKAT